MATVRTMVRLLGPQSAASRVAMTGAAVWATSAVLHTVVFLVDGGPWEGAVSWRKPIVFSVSVGSLMWAVGWVIDRLPRWRPRTAAWISWAFVVSGSVETGLIVAQTWRGRPSHFNTFESVDAAIFGLMGAMVGVMSLALVALAIWAAVERPRDPAVRLAVLAGLGMVVAGLGIGQWIIDLGVRYTAENGLVPPVVLNGEAGVAKFPHAVAFHGIHVMAVLAALLDVRAATAGARKRAMRLVSGGYLTLLAGSMALTVAGVAPLSPGPVVGTAMLAGVGAVVWGFREAIRALPIGTTARRTVAPAGR